MIRALAVIALAANLRAFLGQFPADLARKVGYENAARVFNLE